MNRQIPQTPAPKPEPGDVAWLEVVTVNDTGAFLAWGRPKDLLLPFSEQKRADRDRLTVGQHCLVIIQFDDEDRPFASMKLDDFIDDAVDPAQPPLKNGQPVQLIVAGNTDIGTKVVVDHRWWGLIHGEDLRRPLRRGESLTGYVKQQRADGKLDITPSPPAHKAAAELTDRILEALAQRGGFLPLSDKSAPEDIQREFGVSKGVYKQAIGALFKQRRIVIAADGIRLASADSGKQ